MCLKVWCHFHCGNVLIENKNIPDDSRKEFAAALEIALASDNHFATMTMNERLGLVAARDNMPATAFSYYDRAASLGQNRGIQRLWAWQCEVRFLIGIGNIYLAKAEKASGAAKAEACKQGQDYYNRAIEMASLIGYVDNKRVAQRNLTELKQICQ